MEVLGAWPPEMSADDRSEVFAALRVPSCATVRALYTGQPLPVQLPRRMLCEGLARVPFNLPDFPVPTHLIRSAGPDFEVDNAAEAIAEAFCLEQTGLERVKDYFLCGLLSLEEIQASLPWFLRDSLVEEAVMRIIRVGSAYFTPREWQMLVVAVRVAPPAEECCEQFQADEPVGSAQEEQAVPHAVAAAHPVAPMLQVDEDQARKHDLLPSLLSPAQQSRQVAAAAPAQATAGWGASTAHAAAAVDGVAAGGAAALDTLQNEDAGRVEPEALAPTGELRLATGVAPASVAMTEPLPKRGVRCEEPVRFFVGHRVINWSTTRWSAAEPPREDEGAVVDTDHVLANSISLGDPSHQADQGAGTRAGHEVEQVPESLQRPVVRGDDPVRLISMDMHNECLGPFLALAFVRCCQLYEARRGYHEMR